MIGLSYQSEILTFVFLDFSLLPDARLRTLPRNFKSWIGENGISGKNKFN